MSRGQHATPSLTFRIGQIGGDACTHHILQMAWHLGYPLSQTLFTNLYIERMQMPTPTTIDLADFIRDADPSKPRSPMHAVLRAYCLGLLKSCWYVLDCIKYEHFYEVRPRLSATHPYPVHNPFLFYYLDLFRADRGAITGRRLRHQHVPPLTSGLDTSRQDPRCHPGGARDGSRPPGLVVD